MEQKQNILHILKTPDLAQKLETCLENVSCNDPIFTTLSNIFSRFPAVYKSPKGIHQLDILHSMFQFSDLDDCLASFQFVCKAWQRAFETMRFEYMITSLPKIWFEQGYTVNWHKIVEKFQKVDLVTIRLDIQENYDIDLDELFEVFAVNCKNLTEVELPFFWEEDEEDSDEAPDHYGVCTKILHRSRKTLKKIKDVPISLFLSNMTFPFLEEIRISLQPDDSESLLQKLISSIPAVAPSLKLVVFDYPQYSEERICPNICAHLAKYHQEKFLAATKVKALNSISSKYLFFKLWPRSDHIEQLCESKHLHDIEYLSISTNFHRPWKEEEEIKSWRNFEKILTLSNIKKISIQMENGKELCSGKNELLSPPLQRIQRLIKNTSIEFVTTKEINDQFEREKKNKLIFQWESCPVS